MYLGSKATCFTHHHLKNVLAFTSPDYAANERGFAQEEQPAVGAPAMDLQFDSFESNRKTEH